MLAKRPALVISILIVVVVVVALIAFTATGRQQASEVRHDVNVLGQETKTGVEDAAAQTKKAAEGAKDSIQKAVR
jgi:K+-transporting ATPase A subunit